MISEYIKGLFGSGLCSTWGEVLSYFKDHGINSNITDTAVQFKYDTLVADWKNPLSYYSRGTIVGIGMNNYCYNLATPFKKFFNFGEFYSKYKTDEDVANFVSKGGKLSQKADGTCIMLYHTPKGWKVSTLGSIDTANAGDNPITFSELFWNTFDKSILYDLTVGTTYIFELCTELNQIVTKYSERKIFLLGALRDYNFDSQSYNTFVKMIEDGSTKVELPKIIDVPKSVTTIELLTEFIRKEFTTNLGENPEGVVGILDGIPQFKYKFPEYCLLHKTMTGDDRYVRKSLVSRFFTETIDDVYDKLTDAQKEFVDALKQKVVYLNELYTNIVTEIYQEGMSPKDFALALKEKNTGEPFNDYCYRWYKTKLSFSEYLCSIVKDSTVYERHMDYFKSL